MDKNEEISKCNHGLSLTERKNLLIYGVKKIENFDNEEFIMETNMGLLTIKGEDLELIKLDTQQGNISIKGSINSLEYSQDKKNKEQNGLISRIFK